MFLLIYLAPFRGALFFVARFEYVMLGDTHAMITQKGALSKRNKVERLGLIRARHRMLLLKRNTEVDDELPCFPDDEDGESGPEKP